MVGYLMHHRLPHEVTDLFIRAADGLHRPLEDGYLIRQHEMLPPIPLSERHPLVEAEEGLVAAYPRSFHLIPRRIGSHYQINVVQPLLELRW